METTQRVFSGIQPSGNLHVGNYLGALKNWVAMQDEYENYFCIVDLHAITVPQDPKELRQKIREVAAIYLASGLDPERCVIFRQSKVSGHAELCWLLNSVARFGELSRMTQFKDKTRKGGVESASAGLFDYPDSIRKKIRRAKTDSGTEIRASQDKPAITNLLDVYSAMSGEPVSGIEADYVGKGYGDFKKDLAEVAVEGLGPVRDRAYELLDDPAELDRLLDSGARRAQEAAQPTLESARTRLGLD